MLATAACSEEGSADDPTTTAHQSFACVEAIQRTGLTDGTPVGDARERLTELVDDASLTQAERDHHAAQLAALEELDPDEAVGERLDDVPCDL